MSTRHRAGVPTDGFSLVREGVTAQALSSTGVGGLLGAEPLGRPPRMPSRAWRAARTVPARQGELMGGGREEERS